MNQQKILEQYIKDKGGFSGELPKIITQLASIINTSVHPRMSATIAVSEMTTFIGNLRRNIQLDKNTLIPINSISFVLASSGVKKDSTANNMRKAFKEGYNLIEQQRMEDAKLQAINQATIEGRDNPDTYPVYSEFYVKPPLLFAGISTEQGIFKHCNKLEHAKLGAGFIYTGELGSELQTNQNMITNIRFASVVYDIGKADVTLLKGEENQLEPIRNLPVSALFLGSHENILFDEIIKNRFKIEFTTKLARRSFFCFVPEQPILPQYNTAEELIEASKIKKSQNQITLDKLQSSIESVADYHLQYKHKNKPITIEEEAYNIYLAYERWCLEKSKTIAAEYPISKITIEHRHWAALKLSGAIAMMQNRDSINSDNYIDAINYIDYMSNDLPNFEDELRKDVFEQFIEYMHLIAKDGKSEIQFHKMLKQGYIHKSGGIISKVKEIIKLANSKDSSGIYTLKETSVIYEKTVLTDEIGVSFIAMPKTANKTQRGVIVAQNVLKYVTGTFEDLIPLLQDNYAYSPFEFKNGIRSVDNLIPETKWLTLDIDQAIVSDETAHDMLSDINHHIARTSNKDNPMKYRLLIELDSKISLTSKQWKKFMIAVENLLCIPLDKLPMSQIFFSWSDRKVLSVVDKHPLETKDLLMIATEVKEDSNQIDTSKLTKAQKSDLLKNPLETFWYMFEAENGSGSRNMIKAVYHIRALGGTKEDAETLVRKANDFWVAPMPERRLTTTILSQLENIFK